MIRQEIAEPALEAMKYASEAGLGRAPQSGEELLVVSRYVFIRSGRQARAMRVAIRIPVASLWRPSAMRTRTRRQNLGKRKLAGGL